jgi:hypothetical protein
VHCDASLESGREIALPDAAAQHIVKVLRLHAGQPLVLFDGHGQEHDAEIVAHDAPLAEDCSTPGDEDGNGLADCADPACADTPTCKAVCGNGKVEASEQCDSGSCRHQFVQ